MTKDELMAQVYSEINAEENVWLTQRDIAFFNARKKDKTLTRAEFYRTYKANRKIPSARNRYIEKLVELNGFNSKAPSDFKNPPTDSHKNLYTQLANYCKKFPAIKNLVIHGDTGCGKTYITHIITNNLTKQGKNVLYVTAFGLVERFRKYTQGYGDVTQMDALLECDLLIIDDLGSEPIIKNNTHEHLYNVINERLVNEKPFIITTNFNEAELKERYDRRVLSRILSLETSIVIKMESEDLRLKKKSSSK